MIGPVEIRSVGRDELPALFLYLDEHLQDNGRDGAPLFQPMPRGARFTPQLAASFAAGMEAALGCPGWRRVWTARGADGAILGHVDLRARPEPAAGHRALLGMGVQGRFRRQGLGRVLLDAALSWARAHAALEWIDLEVLSGNHPARRLYEIAGFTVTGETIDMFRVDGESLDYVFMTHRLHPAPPRPGRAG